LAKIVIPDERSESRNPGKINRFVALRFPDHAPLHLLEKPFSPKNAKDRKPLMVKGIVIHVKVYKMGIHGDPAAYVTIGICTVLLKPSSFLMIMKLPEPLIRPLFYSRNLLGSLFKSSYIIISPDPLF
jgi:hypothetical protein